jgi:hypothetical protein
MFRVRAGLEHADIEAARQAARQLVTALEALPTERAEYERLCDEADKELSVTPGRGTSRPGPERLCPVLASRLRTASRSARRVAAP